MVDDSIVHGTGSLGLVGVMCTDFYQDPGVTSGTGVEGDVVYTDIGPSIY